MDNENKINNDKKKLVKSFITENVAEKYEKPKLYDLQKEFSKTKKNKQTFLWIMIFAFLALIILITLLLNIYITNKRQLTSFKIPEFQEINLKDLLDTAKKLQEKLDIAKEELNSLKQEKSLAIQKVKETTSNEIQLALVKDISKVQKDKEVRNLKYKQNKLIKEINQKYDPLIAKKQKEIEDIQKELDKYDSRLNAQVREAQKQLQRYKELSALEMKKKEDFYNKKIKNITDSYESQIQNLKEYYKEYITVLENKYNPVFKERKIKKILNNLEENQIPENYQKFNNFNYLINNNILNTDEKKQIEKSFSDLFILTNRLSEIPYKNSVPIALNKIIEDVNYLNFKYNSILENINKRLTEYDNKINEYNNQINDKNNKISDLKQKISLLNKTELTIQTSLDFYLTKIKEDGVVISKIENNSYYIYIKSGVELFKNQEVFITRGTKLIAKGIVSYSEGYFIVKINDFINNEQIYPFDIVNLLYNY